MGHIDRCGAQLPLQVNDAGAGAVAQLGVQVAERFIHQKHRRFPRHGTPQGNPLFLPAGELLRQAVEEWFQLQGLGHGVDALFNQLLPRGAHPQERGKSAAELAELILQLLRQAAMAATSQPEAEVVAHAQVRIERVALEHHGHVATPGPHLAHGALADDNFTRSGAL